MSNSNDKIQLSVSCHCGDVKGKFYLRNIENNNITAIDCNCSDCAMRGNTHLIIPQNDFSVDLQQGKTLDDVTIFYEWGTKTAKRNFCRRCGILPWYRPRSNPNGVAITLRCIDWGDREKPSVEIKLFDGIHWEESFAASKISEMSATNK
mmetsp:Transcript_6292/g.7974  ORF Transcript_6292/g.7974 Transcript_6292/m.7974 type:complete len:150 (-) Transcript_6292:133-582(-)